MDAQIFLSPEVAALMRAIVKGLILFAWLAACFVILRRKDTYKRKLARICWTVVISIVIYILACLYYAP